MCRGGTLQSAECHSCTLVAECHPGTSDSLLNFTPVVREVSPQGFLPILGAPRPKITNRPFWPACDQMVLLTGLRPKPGFGTCDRRGSISLSRNFWPMVRLMGGGGLTVNFCRYFFRTPPPFHLCMGNLYVSISAQKQFSNFFDYFYSFLWAFGHDISIWAHCGFFEKRPPLSVILPSPFYFWLPVFRSPRGQT